MTARDTADPSHHHQHQPHQDHAGVTYVGTSGATRAPTWQVTNHACEIAPRYFICLPRRSGPYVNAHREFTAPTEPAHPPARPVHRPGRCAPADRSQPRRDAVKRPIASVIVEPSPAPASLTLRCHRVARHGPVAFCASLATIGVPRISSPAGARTTGRHCVDLETTEGGNRGGIGEPPAGGR